MAPTFPTEGPTTAEGGRLTPDGDAPMAALAYIHDYASPAENSPLRLAAAEFLAIRAESDAQAARVMAAAEAADALYPDVPASIRNPRRPDLPLNRIELQQLDETANRLDCLVPEGDSRVEAFERWIAQKDAIDRTFGLPDLDAAWEKMKDAESAVAHRVVALKPRSVQEAAIKYGVLLAAFASHDQEDITAPGAFFNFLADLKDLANPG